MKTLTLLAVLLALLGLSSAAQADLADMKVGISVTSSSAQAVPSNSRRTYLALCNVGSANPMTCSTTTATATNGQVIAAGACKIFEGKPLAKRKFNCISASGTTASYDEVVDEASMLTAPTPSPVPTP